MRLLLESSSNETIMQTTRTSSRFVVWSPRLEVAQTVEGQPPQLELLAKFGVERLAEIHGIESERFPEQATEMDTFLRQHDLGMLARASWPGQESMGKNPRSIQDQSVQILGLSVRPTNCLLRAGIATIGELIQKSDLELCRLPSMGRRSMAEIREKLLYAGLERVEAAQTPSELAHCVSHFPLALLMSFEKCGVSGKLARRLRSGKLENLYNLVAASLPTVRNRFNLRPGEVQTLNTLLLDFGLRLGYTPPTWITTHFEDFRSAFSEEIESFKVGSLALIQENLITTSENLQPDSLESELESWFDVRAREKKVQITRKAPGLGRKRRRDFGGSWPRIQHYSRACSADFVRCN